MKDIICLESEWNKVIMRGRESTTIVLTRLKKLEKILDQRFVRINRTCIINLDYLYNLDNSEGLVCMTDGSVYELEDARIKEFKRGLLSHLIINLNTN